MKRVVIQTANHGFVVRIRPDRGNQTLDAIPATLGDEPKIGGRAAYEIPVGVIHEAHHVGMFSGLLHHKIGLRFVDFSQDGVGARSVPSGVMPDFHIARLQPNREFRHQGRVPFEAFAVFLPQRLLVGEKRSGKRTIVADVKKFEFATGCRGQRHSTFDKR